MQSWIFITSVLLFLHGLVRLSSSSLAILFNDALLNLDENVEGSGNVENFINFISSKPGKNVTTPGPSSKLSFIQEFLEDTEDIFSSGDMSTAMKTTKTILTTSYNISKSSSMLQDYDYDVINITTDSTSKLQSIDQYELTSLHSIHPEIYQTSTQSSHMNHTDHVTVTHTDNYTSLVDLRDITDTDLITTESIMFDSTSDISVNISYGFDNLATTIETQNITLSEETSDDTLAVTLMFNVTSVYENISYDDTSIDVEIYSTGITTDMQFIELTDDSMSTIKNEKDLTSIDTSSSLQLTTFEDDTDLTSIDIYSSTQLITIEDEKDLTTIDTSLSPDLTSIEYEKDLTTIDTSLSPELTSTEYEKDLTTIDTSLSSDLTSIEYEKDLTTIDTSLSPELTSIEDEKDLTTIDTSLSPELTSIEYEKDLTTIDTTLSLELTSNQDEKVLVTHPHSTEEIFTSQDPSTELTIIKSKVVLTSHHPSTEIPKIITTEEPVELTSEVIIQPVAPDLTEIQTSSSVSSTSVYPTTEVKPKEKDNIDKSKDKWKTSSVFIIIKLVYGDSLENKDLKHRYEKGLLRAYLVGMIRKNGKKNRKKRQLMDANTDGLSVKILDMTELPDNTIQVTFVVLKSSGYPIDRVTVYNTLRNIDLIELSVYLIARVIDGPLIDGMKAGLTSPDVQEESLPWYLTMILIILAIVVIALLLFIAIHYASRNGYNRAAYSFTDIQNDHSIPTLEAAKKKSEAMSPYSPYVNMGYKRDIFDIEGEKAAKQPHVDIEMIANGDQGIDNRCFVSSEGIREGLI